MHRFLCALSSCAALAVCALLACAGLPAALDPLLSACTADLPKGDADTTLVLRLEDAGKARAQPGAGSLYVVVQRRGGTWSAEGSRPIAEWHEKTFGSIDASALVLNGDALSGTIKVAVWSGTAQPKKPAPQPKVQPPEADVFTIAIDARIQRAKPLPWQFDPLASMPFWRKEVPLYGGVVVAGTWKAGAGSGAVSGGLNAAPVVGTWGCEGNLTIAPQAGGGMACIARLSPHRVAAPHGARAVLLLTQTQDWSAFSGLRLYLSSPLRRNEATVTLSVREADGTWYAVQGAGLLLGADSQADIPFTDFRRSSGWDENTRLDLTEIDAIAVGIDQPSGVGEVAFSVSRIELIKDAPKPVPLAPSVGLGNALLAINGTATVPAMLFGLYDAGDPPSATGAAALARLHALKPGLLRYIDHTGWGGKPATDAATATAIATALADRAKTKPVWADKRAPRAASAGAVVMIAGSEDLFKRPSWMDRGIAATLPLVQSWHRDLAGKAFAPGDDQNPLRYLEVWNEPFMWGRHINLGTRQPSGKQAWVDATQHGYLPGEVGADAYAQIFLAAAAGAKSANLAVQLCGPSAPGFAEDDFTSFFNYTARILDRIHGKLDAITEHHYQGEPPSYAAANLVVSAYCDAKFGRRIPIINTETNGAPDTPTKGADGSPPSWSLKVDQLNLAHYNLSDILWNLALCPDVAIGRSLYSRGGIWNNRGELDAWHLMAPLRGQLVALEVEGDELVAVAAQGSDGSVQVLMLNDGEQTREIALRVPAGVAFGEAETLGFDDGTHVQRFTPKLDATGRACILHFGPRQATRFSLTGWKPARTVQRQSAALDTVNLHVTTRATSSAKILWRAVANTGATRAWLRVITRDVQRGEGIATVNGVDLPLPWSASHEGGQRVQDLALDPKLLAGSDDVRFRCADAATSNGFTVLTAFIVVEH